MPAKRRPRLYSVLRPFSRTLHDPLQSRHGQGPLQPDCSGRKERVSGLRHYRHTPKDTSHGFEHIPLWPRSFVHAASQPQVSGSPGA
jgi:hypothetical protein